MKLLLPLLLSLLRGRHLPRVDHRLILQLLKVLQFLDLKKLLRIITLHLVQQIVQIIPLILQKYLKFLLLLILLPLKLLNHLVDQLLVFFSLLLLSVLLSHF